MRRLGEAGCTDNILTNLWLQALPNTTRAIIAAIPTATLDDQAKVADKILEAPRKQISSIQHRGDGATKNSLEQRIEALTQRLDEALTGNPHRRNRFSNTRSRSCSRRDGTPARNKRGWICWFYFRHGSQARKCEKQKADNPNVPCIFFDGKIEVYFRPRPM